MVWYVVKPFELGELNIPDKTLLVVWPDKIVCPVTFKLAGTEAPLAGGPSKFPFKVTVTDVGVEEL